MPIITPNEVLADIQFFTKTPAYFTPDTADNFIRDYAASFTNFKKLHLLILGAYGTPLAAYVAKHIIEQNPDVLNDFTKDELVTIATAQNKSFEVILQGIIDTNPGILSEITIEDYVLINKTDVDRKLNSFLKAIIEQNEEKFAKITLNELLVLDPKKSGINILIANCPDFFKNTTPKEVLEMANNYKPNFDLFSDRLTSDELTKLVFEKNPELLKKFSVGNIIRLASIARAFNKLVINALAKDPDTLIKLFTTATTRQRAKLRQLITFETLNGFNSSANISARSTTTDIYIPGDTSVVAIKGNGGKTLLAVQTSTSLDIPSADKYTVFGSIDALAGYLNAQKNVLGITDDQMANILTAAKIIFPETTAISAR